MHARWGPNPGEPRRRVESGRERRRQRGLLQAPSLKAAWPAPGGRVSGLPSVQPILPCCAASGSMLWQLAAWRKSARRPPAPIHAGCCVRVCYPQRPPQSCRRQRRIFQASRGLLVAAAAAIHGPPCLRIVGCGERAAAWPPPPPGPWLLARCTRCCKRRRPWWLVSLHTGRRCASACVVRVHLGDQRGGWGPRGAATATHARAGNRAVMLASGGVQRVYSWISVLKTPRRPCCAPSCFNRAVIARQRATRQGSHEHGGHRTSLNPLFLAPKRLKNALGSPAGPRAAQRRPGRRACDVAAC